MTIARRLFSAGAVAGLTVVLAGCMGFGGGGTPAARKASGIEGAWIDAQGTGLSTLQGGIFATTAIDTGQKLAEGSYTLSGADSVQITGVSILRRSRGEPSDISFNCRLASTSQLNCTSSTGQQFVLTRRA
jgi:hypothetical protein